MTQRVVCLLVCEMNYLNRPLGKTSRWVVRGSRLLKKICGPTRTRREMARGSGGARPKAAPLQTVFATLTALPRFHTVPRDCDLTCSANTS